MARTPVRITDLSTDTAQVVKTDPTSTSYGLVVRIAGTVPGTTAQQDSEHAEDSAHVSGDIGVMMLAVQSSTVGSLVNANFDYAPLQVDSSGHLRTILPDALMIQEPVLAQLLRADVAAVTSVTASTSATLLLSTSATRIGVLMFNDSANAAFIKYGTGVTTTSFSIKLAANSQFEMATPIFRGKLQAKWAAAAGAMRITELTS